jgi:hypothetical protein
MSMSANQESGPPLHVLLEINEAVADMQRLVLLDAAWTRVAEGGDELGERDREALVSLGNQMDVQLSTVERHAHGLRQTFDRYRVWVNERVRSGLASEHLSDAQQEDVRRILKAEDDDFAGRGVALTDLLARRVPVEREELRSKIPALRENGPVVTDMADETGCALVSVAIMGGLLTCFETAGAGCAVAAGFTIFAVAAGC